MLVNFCDHRLRPEIKCNTISTEGYEVTNLINNSCKGFLAYSCIKPPVYIDITFICNIKIHHILIWPSVGAQKSLGFQLYSRTNDNTSYTLLSNGYLNPCDNGLLFYPADVDLKKISTPPNFLKRYIKVSMRYLTRNTTGLRISICKTQNSVPALGKIEIWGTVSASCKNDIMKNVYALWSKYAVPLFTDERKTVSTSVADTTCNREENTVETLEIPEAFLDAITWELMTQPIALPSGKIIDQTTLEKHERSEAVWGRPLSDPFTNLPFNEQRKPIMAIALKSRIDKFLLENSNSEEIKKLPRVLGHSLASSRTRDRRIEMLIENLPGKVTANDIKVNKRAQAINDTLQRTKRHCHQLPAIVQYPKQFTLNCNPKPKQMTKALNICIPGHNSVHIQNKVEVPETLMNNTDSVLGSTGSNMTILLSDIKHFSTPEKVELYNVYSNCKCCNNNILYRLPCKHVICRKMLLSIKNNQCKFCGSLYKSSDVERIHD